MHIKSISISNFRSISKQTFFAKDYNVLVGSNGAGKSTILHALNVFFGEYSNFKNSDFTRGKTSNPIEISVTFENFSEEAKEEFNHYIRHNEMTILVKVTCKSEGVFVLKRHGERLVNPKFIAFFEAPKSPVSKRREIYQELRKRNPLLPSASTGTAMEVALRDFEEAMPAEEKEIRRSEDEFFGASKGTGKLGKFMTWVYVPAVKDAAAESEEAKNSHLGKLIQHTVRSAMNYSEELDDITNDARRRYEVLLTDQRKHLVSLEERLQEKLKASITSDAGIELQWKSDEKSIFVSEPNATVQLQDNGFKGDVNSFGHGLQRSFLLVILQELLAEDSKSSPTLILGCEEPELYQHPPQARHLASVLRNLTKGDAQVFITTHSPYFIDIESLNGLQRVSNTGKNIQVYSGSFEKLTGQYNKFFDEQARKIDTVKAKIGLQIQPKTNEIFFSDFVVLVEGISDRSCFETYLRLSGRDDEFRKLGCNIVEAYGKSSLILVQLLLKEFAIPHYVILDCDGDESNVGRRKLHEHDNKTAFNLAGLKTKDVFPKKALIDVKLTAWPNTIDDVLDEQFGKLRTDALEAGQNAVGGLKIVTSRKYPFFVASAMQFAWDNGCRFEAFSAIWDKISDLAKHKTKP